MYSPFRPDGGGVPDQHGAAATAYQQSVGAAFSQFGASQDWERGIIYEVYPDVYTCDVYTERGRFLTSVPWPSTGGSIVVPEQGAEYVVHFHLGAPTLHEAATSVKAAPDADAPPKRVTPVRSVGGEDHVHQGKGTGNQRGDQPRDVLAGDKITLGEMGNMVGVLAGGSTVVKAGDLAQIIATQSQNLLRLIGQNFSLFTGAGTLDFTTENGKTSMLLRAGSDSESESDPSAENFRIRCELGDAGEMVDFRVTDGKGRSLYRLHVDPDGRVETEAKRKTEIIEEDVHTEIGDDDYKEVGGNYERYVRGASSEYVHGDSSTSAQGSVKVQAMRDAALSGMNDVFMHAGRNMALSASGEVTGRDPAFLATIANGDVMFKVGHPSAGDAGVRQSGFEVDAVTGRVVLGTTLGKIELNAGFGKTKVGGYPGVGPYSAVLYDLLKVFMDMFGSLIDNHVHLIPVLGLSPTLPPLIPPYMLSRGLLPAAKSRYVKLGG